MTSSSAPRHRRRGGRGPIAAVCAAIVLASLAIAPAASATPLAATGADLDTAPSPTLDGSNWWFDLLAVGDAHERGLTGEGIRIAVIDSQINPDLPVFEGASLEVAGDALCEGGAPTSSEPTEAALHGSRVTAFLVGNGTGPGAVRGVAPDAEVTFYGYGDRDLQPDCAPPEFDGALSAFGLGLQRAIDDGAQIVTTSGTAFHTEDDLLVMANAIAKGVIVVVATLNPVLSGATDIDALNGVVAVAAVDNQGSLPPGLDGSPFASATTTVVAPGWGLQGVGDGESWNGASSISGTSFATPITAGMLALAVQANPDASSAQVLQALLRTTDGSEHEPAADPDSGYGYGGAWLPSLLSVEASAFPDEHPLLDKPPLDKPLSVPTAEQIAAAAERGFAYDGPAASFDAYDDESAEPSSGAADDDAPGFEPGGSGTDGVGSGVIVVLVVIVVVLAGGILAIVLRARHQRRRGRP